MLAKYTADGDLEWTRLIGFGGYTFGQGIRVDRAGNTYVAGQTGVPISKKGQEGSTDYFVMKS